MAQRQSPIGKRLSPAHKACVTILKLSTHWQHINWVGETEVDRCDLRTMKTSALAQAAKNHTKTLCCNALCVAAHPAHAQESVPLPKPQWKNALRTNHPRLNCLCTLL
eukprot:5034391-Amphidinium_carterae.1